MTDSPPSARRETIAARLAGGTPVNATALAEEFDVSEDAIRRDLRALAAEGKCRRVYGGALPISPATGSFSERLGDDALRKRALGRAACALLKENDVVFLDNGTTNLAFAELLPADLNLTIVTNSVAIASAVFGRQGLELVMLGGPISREVGGAVDAAAVEGLRQVNIDICFLGVCALSHERGAAVFYASDAAFKRAAMAASTATAALLTSEKLETRAPHRVALLQDIAYLVLEADAPAEVMQAYQEGGTEVHLAKSPG